MADQTDWMKLLMQLPQMNNQQGYNGPADLLPPAMPKMNFNVQSPQYDPQGAPMFSGGASVPAFGGNLGVQGRFQSQQQRSPILEALMRYTRDF